MPCTSAVVDCGPTGKSENVSLPLNNGFKLGTVIQAVAVTNNKTRFEIQDHEGNCLMVMSVRINQNEIVFNNKEHCVWGAEERPCEMPVKGGIKYCLHIAYESNGFRIFVNGEDLHFYKHRICNLPTLFKIQDGHIFSTTYKNNEPIWAIQDSINNQLYRQDFGCTQDGIGCTQDGISMQLQGPNTLSWILITGYMSHNAHNVAFNLQTSSGGIVLHFNPRFDSQYNYVVRNTCLGNWGPEETSGGMPFQLNQKFALAIVVEPHCYRTYVNGEEFVTYNHRTPANTVSTLVVSSPIKICKIIYHK